MKGSVVVGWTLSPIFTTAEAAPDRCLPTGQLLSVRRALGNAWTSLNSIRDEGELQHHGHNLSHVYSSATLTLSPVFYLLKSRLILGGMQLQDLIKRSFSWSRTLKQWRRFGICVSVGLYCLSLSSCSSVFQCFDLGKSAFYSPQSLQLLKKSLSHRYWTLWNPFRPTRWSFGATEL